MMKKLLFLLFALPLFTFAIDAQIPSTIKAVTVYLSGAHITRTAECQLPSGMSEMVFTGLSTKIDESSIQISGLQAVSILSLSYDIDYLVKAVATSESSALQLEIEGLQNQIALLKNKISGLEEEEQVIYTNRAVRSTLQSFDLEKIKAVSSYYRERITAIKDEIFKTNLEINSLGVTIRAIQKQMAEANNAPEREQGEITIKFDAPIATKLELTLSYQVDDAGWIPNYEIKSKDVHSPLTLAYKAHVYQKTGTNWDNVKVTLSTGNPSINVVKPNLGTKYLNFTNGYQSTSTNSVKKRKYVYNPSVREVTGVVLDQSGAPLPGASVLVKGTTMGTTTDFDGHYSLVVEHGQELVISYVGFSSEVLPIYSSVMNIGLAEDASALEEVVVTGYGSKRTSNLTRAVRTVTSEELMSGRSPGVSIRGMSTLKGRSTPLYIMDGIHISAAEIAEINPDIIASVEVLKGIEATSLYGSRGNSGVVVMTSKKSTVQDDVTNTKFVIKKPYSIISDGDITAIEINTFTLNAEYEYLAVPIVNENVFLTTTFTDWEQYNLLPGEASVYFKGTYAGKTTIDPYTTKKEMTVSLGIDPNITVTRKQDKNFKSKSFIGSNRILDRTYDLEIKNNKSKTVNIKLLDRIPISQNKDIKVDDVVTNDADYDKKTGLLTWKLNLAGNESLTKRFSFQLRYPKYKRISL